MKKYFTPFHRIALLLTLALLIGIAPTAVADEEAAEATLSEVVTTTKAVEDPTLGSVDDPAQPLFLEGDCAAPASNLTIESVPGDPLFTNDGSCDDCQGGCSISCSSHPDCSLKCPFGVGFCNTSIGKCVCAC